MPRSQRKSRRASNAGIKGVPQVPDATHARAFHRQVGAVVVITALMVIALFVFVFLLNRTSANVSQQQTSDGQAQQSQSDSTSDDSDATTEDEDEAARRVRTAVPDLTSVMGRSQRDALSIIGHGATVTSTQNANGSDSPIVSNVTVALTQEPGDSKQGTPTVYLGLNSDGAVIHAGYSSPTSLLGFGRLSFSDAILNEHIVEQTLERAGVTVSQGNISLPSSKKDYSTYGSDGHTLVQEHATFQGEGVGKDGRTYAWAAQIVYDYTRANATGNLADASHVIYVYIDEQ